MVRSGFAWRFAVLALLLAFVAIQCCGNEKVDVQPKQKSAWRKRNSAAFHPSGPQTEFNKELRSAHQHFRDDALVTRSPDGSPEKSKEDDKNKKSQKRLEDDVKIDTKGTEGNTGSYNNTLREKTTSLETVARRGGNSTERKEDKNDEDVARLVDSKDNEYVITKPKDTASLVQDFVLVTDLIATIVGATLGGVLMSVLGQEPLIGYVLGGMMLGPGGLNVIDELVQVETIAQFGVIFLLFNAGIECDIAKLRTHQLTSVVGGTLQIVACMAVCGAAAYMLGYEVSPNAIVLGMYVPLSSTAVVLRCLKDNGMMHSRAAEISLGILVYQDIAVGLMITFLPSLRARSGNITEALVRQVASSLVFAIVVYVLSRGAIPRLLDAAAKLRSLEIRLLSTLSFCLTIALAAEEIGLSLECGSFVAGLLVASSPGGNAVRAHVEPVKDVFATLFFASVGMLVNFNFIRNNVRLLIIATMMIMVLKCLIFSSIVYIFSLRKRESLQIGVILCQIGEFSFVLASRAQSLQLISREVYLLLLGSAAVSLLWTPFIFRWMAKKLPVELDKAACV